MPMSEEARKAQSERMKARHAANREKPPENGHAETAKEIIQQFTDNLPAEKPNILVSVDWQRIPILEGQQLYAKLRTEFEKAGTILNARSFKSDNGFKCFMCKGDFEGMPAFRDDSYKDNKTGLLVPVRICGQICAERYNVMLFEQRRDRNQRQEQESRA